MVFLQGVPKFNFLGNRAMIYPANHVICPSREILGHTMVPSLAHELRIDLAYFPQKIGIPKMLSNDVF